jgi:hypothetical protein
LSLGQVGPTPEAPLHRPARGFPLRLGPIAFAGLCGVPHGKSWAPEGEAESPLLPEECPRPMARLYREWPGYQDSFVDFNIPGRGSSRAHTRCGEA